VLDAANLSGKKTRRRYVEAYEGACSDAGPVKCSGNGKAAVNSSTIASQIGFLVGSGMRLRISRL